MKNVEVIPAILSPTLEEIRSHLLRVHGITRTVQIDVCDGFFVPFRTWPMHTNDKEIFERMVRGHEAFPYADDFDFEVDLMVHQPEKILSDWARLGATRAVFHLKARHSLDELKRTAHESGIELGVAIGPSTDVGRLESYLPHVEYVQVMGIEHIGQQGEPFSEKAISTVRAIREAYPSGTIQVDGGVSDTSHRALIEAGVDRLVSGSFIFNADDTRAALETLAHG